MCYNSETANCTHVLKGLATAVGINSGLVHSGLRLMRVSLMKVQQRQQLLPALAIHYLAQAIRPLCKALAIFCIINNSRSLTHLQHPVFRMSCSLRSPVAGRMPHASPYILMPTPGMTAERMGMK